MQNCPAFEMPAAMQERHSIPKRMRRAFPKPNVGIVAHDPRAIGRMQMDWGVMKGAAPFDHGRVVVRVRNGDSANAAERVDALNGSIVEQRHAIPQNISARRLDEKGTLPDRERRLRPDAEKIRSFSLDPIRVIGSQLLERGPLLPVPVHVLPLIVANRTTRRRLLGFAELCAARDANVITHNSPSPLVATALWAVQGLTARLSKEDLYGPQGRGYNQKRTEELVELSLTSKLAPMPATTSVKAALQSAAPIASIQVQGWVRTRRDSKDFSFIELNDGSCLRNLQIIAKNTLPNYAAVQHLITGASITVRGALVASQGKGQSWEVVADKIEIVGASDDTYPLQKKGHTPEFLREIAHLRPRSNLFGAVFRVRSRLAFAIHQFFQERGFVYVHTPIITGSDCEGAGELFRVTSIDPKNPPRRPDGAIDYAQDFFARSTFLTVSGQLEAEAFACALSKVYTFGPTFRAENSNTSRHANEFWMIEPEMAFTDLQGNMDVAEEIVKYLIRDIREHCAEDLELFAKFVDKELIARLDFVMERPFQRITYTEAVELLAESGEKFEFPVAYGANLQSEHERWLTEKHFKCPVTVFNYPKEIKPFYMRLNDDGKTVTAMDVLVPGIGEVVGGSQREERLEVLEENMRRHKMDPVDYKWYLDLRRYGTVPHSGFGLGFERMLMFVTGVSNIRDVIPFARTPGSAEF
jgi:asparaginyl-tRNA synthetase